MDFSLRYVRWCLNQHPTQNWHPQILHNEGHFTYKIGHVTIAFQALSLVEKAEPGSKFASHYAWGTDGVCEGKMDVKFTWILSWHRMDHVSWSFGLFSKTTSCR